METPKLLTDDMDIRDTELSMYYGNNGDYYICLEETKRGKIVKLDTRIAMSGGNASTEVKLAVANLFKALRGESSDERSGLHLADVSKSLLEKERSAGYSEGWQCCLDAHGLDE